MPRIQSLYWIGLYEPLHLKKWEWFFQVDLTRAICYCFLRFIGGGEGSLHLRGGGGSCGDSCPRSYCPRH